jgi:hypothetical protein
MPEVPLHFPELAGLTEAQLERLASDESALKVGLRKAHAFTCSRVLTSMSTFAI